MSHMYIGDSTRTKNMYFDFLPFLEYMYYNKTHIYALTQSFLQISTLLASGKCTTQAQINLKVLLKVQKPPKLGSI